MKTSKEIDLQMQEVNKYVAKKAGMGCLFLIILPAVIFGVIVYNIIS